MLVPEGLIGLHRTVQLQLLQSYWSGHRLVLPWYWMVCLGNEQRSFCHFWDCIQVMHFWEMITWLNCSSHRATQSETLKPSPGGTVGKNDHFTWKSWDVTFLEVSHLTHVSMSLCHVCGEAQSSLFSLKIWFPLLGTRLHTAWGAG